MGGSLAEALDAGVRLGAHWIEIYSLDGDNPKRDAADRYRGAIAGRGGAVKQGRRSVASLRH